MANSIASLVKTKAFQAAGSFDTFSSFGVSLNSPLSSSAIGVGKAALSQIASNMLFNKTLSATPYQRIGMVYGDGDQLDTKYRVSIQSTNLERTITGYLQDRTNLKVLSSWERFVPFGNDWLSTAMEKVVQVTGHSLQNIALSRRMWTGTTPISMSLNLTFEAITDAMAEVVEPCKALLKLASPSRYGTFDWKGALTGAAAGLKTTGGNLGAGIASGIAGSKISADANANGFFLAPPGPYPFRESSKFGDTIQINIGEFLMFTPVIIGAAEVDFDTRIDSHGSPISAKARVDFQTYQVLGKQDIDKAFTPSTRGMTNRLGPVKKAIASMAGI